MNMFFINSSNFLDRWGGGEGGGERKILNSLISHSEPDLKDEKSQAFNKCFTWIKTLFLVLLCKNKRK